jgi:hypothetical protein
MNGERLAPDHGFPVRCLIPGMIGGRQVKWLKEIIGNLPLLTSRFANVNKYDHNSLPYLVNCARRNSVRVF